MAGDLGRCFFTSSEVSPGHDVYNPVSIASIHVEWTGLKAALCRYVTMSRFLFNSYTLLQWEEMEEIGLFDEISIVHIPVVWSRWPWRDNVGSR